MFIKKNVGLSDLIPKPKPLVLPDELPRKAKYFVIYRDVYGNKMSHFGKARAALIEYERLTNKNHECEVYDNKRNKLKIELNENRVRFGPKFKFSE